MGQAGRHHSHWRGTLGPSSLWSHPLVSKSPFLALYDANLMAAGSSVQNSGVCGASLHCEWSQSLSAVRGDPSTAGKSYQLLEKTLQTSRFCPQMEDSGALGTQARPTGI